jgi:hypothetical protein
VIAPTSEKLAMNPFASYLAAMHLQDLLDEAALSRRARLARPAQPSVPAWRRSLGGILVSAGRSLDPSVGSERASRRSDAGVGRALAS